MNPIESPIEPPKYMYCNYANINHLPSPTTDTFNLLDKLFKEFLWRGKPPKFRKEILESAYNLGGLKLTDLRTLDKSLKISWLKRLKNPTDGWEEFPRVLNIHKIIIYGDKYPCNIIDKINNQFWKDVVQSCILFQQKIKNNITWPQNIPIWFNSKLNIPFKKEWAKKGYLCISDFLNDHGTLMTIQNMRINGLLINFLDYEKLRYDISNLDMKIPDNMVLGPYLPYILFKIGYNQKGCSKTYNILMEFNYNIITEVQNKWETVLNEYIPDKKIEEAFRSIHNMEEGYFHKYVQYKMIHRRIVTNKTLYKMKIKECQFCPHCENIEETIEHAFIECKMAKKIWSSVEKWLQQYIERGIKVSDIDKIFGMNMQGNFIDKTIIATKMVIYRNRQKGKNYHIEEVKSLLRQQMLLEEYDASVRGRKNEFLDIWERAYAHIL